MQFAFTEKQIVAFLLAIGVVDGLLVGALIGSQTSPATGVLVGIAVLVFPFVLIPLITLPLSYVTGWRRLVRRFPGVEPSPDATEGEHLVCLAIGRRWMQYNNCARWAADDEHLHLRMGFIFRAGHAPLSIPWSEVVDIEDERMGFVRINLGSTRLWLPAEAAQRERRVRDAIDPGAEA